MEEDFLGRRTELQLLEAGYRSEGGAFIPVYGRRRIGKSELILHFLGSRPAVYHVGKVATPELQIREFLDEAARSLGEPLLAQVAATDWRGALEAVEKAWKQPKKLVLAFDEFQWTAAASPELPSLLQELWDRRWKRGKVMLILCGSMIGFMEREVLGAKSPLFGRRTAQIHLQPFGFQEATAFHPRWSRTDQAKVRFVVGGVASYLRAFDPARSFEQNLVANLFSEFAPLFQEPEFLLREELREVASYHAVLSAIAAGETSIRGIANASGLAERGLTYYLDQLQALGYVARRYPLTAKKPNARQLRFVLEDPLLRFWFRFVFPHKSAVQRLGPARAFAELVKPHLDSYFGGCFERLCREALAAEYARDGVAGFTVGEYWDATTQLDVVGMRADGWIDLGECKWGAVGSVPAVVGELARKAAAYPNPGGATIGRRMFVHRIPARAPRTRDSDVSWHSLDELYATRR
ncbi:MAG: ATP-binding protein [Myxococcales bacterium]|nr:ATP-binding protein [Myxococcales bacterium]